MDKYVSIDLVIYMLNAKLYYDHFLKKVNLYCPVQERS